MEESSLSDQNMEPNMQTIQKDPLSSPPTDHHMHHAHSAHSPPMQAAHEMHEMHNMQNMNDMQTAHEMHQMHSMQAAHDMQGAHDMHGGHSMGMNNSEAADSFSNFLNATDMSLRANGHDHHGIGHSQMDHGSHGSHSGHEGGHSMSMTFHGGVMETILFSWWNVTKVPEFVGSFVAVFIIALLYEGLKYYRKHLLWKTYSGLRYCAVSSPDKGVSNICATDEPTVIQPVPHTVPRNIPTMLSGSHVWQTLLHGVQVLVSYLLMLIFMTYNTWLCSAVVLGSATGYFLFGWRESVVVDFTEHCH